MKPMRAYQTLALLCFAAGCGNSTGGNNPLNDMSQQQQQGADMSKPANMPDMVMAPKPDLATMNTGMDPVGAPCKNASTCSGNKPTCLMSLTGFQTPIPAKGGYCTNKPCASDNDCGTGGFCVAQLGYCLGTCAKPGDCKAANPGNNCFVVDPQNMIDACLPIAGTCDSTSAQSCMGTGACQRLGGAIDPVGNCLTTCNYGAACPNGSMGEPQACYFITGQIDVMGNPTTNGDVLANLVCIYDASAMAAGMGAPDTACMYLNSCKAGYECDFWGGKLCKKLCRNGMNDCTAGTCTNAFKQKAFKMGSVGLCL